jgi:outer membrane protein assembly factor BamB
VTKAAPLLRACALLLLAALAGCGSKGPKPAPLVDFKPSARVHVDWRASIGEAGYYIFTPASYQGSVFAAGSEGDLVRLDAATGKTIWHRDTGSPLSGGVGVGENIVLVGSAKGAVLAYDLNGMLLWQSAVSSEVLSAPSVSGDFVVVRSGDNKIFGLDARDGSRRWEYQTVTPPLTLRANPGVVILENFVLAGMPAGKLIVLSLNNGGVVWETVMATPKGDNELERITDVAGQPLVIGNRVCAVSYQGRVACYETEKGSQLWARPASSAGRLALDDLSVYYSEEVGAVVALDRNSGASVWKQDKLSYRNLSSPAALKDYVAVGDFEGQVHFLKFEDGSFAARAATDGSGIWAAPMVLDDKLIVQTRKGGVYALSIQPENQKQ